MDKPRNRYTKAIEVLQRAIELLLQEGAVADHCVLAPNCCKNPYLKAIETVEKIHAADERSVPIAAACESVYDLSTDKTCDTKPIDLELIYAAGKGQVEKVKQLIRQGADVNAQDNLLEISVLMYAAMYGHESVVSLLLQNGADINARNLYGDVALVYAAMNKHFGVVGILGADKVALDFVLKCAFQNNNVDALDVLKRFKNGTL